MKVQLLFWMGGKRYFRYRGYSIEDQAEKSRFFRSRLLTDLLVNFQTKINWQKFYDDITEESQVDEEMKKILDGFPKSAHPKVFFLH